MNDIHKRGGTVIGTSRGGHDTSKIVDSIQDRGINQVGILSFAILMEIGFLDMFHYNVRTKLQTQILGPLFIALIPSGLYNWWRWNSEGSSCYI